MKKADIRKWARMASYQRGYDIFREGKVLRLEQSEKGESRISLSGDVKGSGRNIYLSEVEYDKKTDRLTDYYCDCPAYDAYPSLCKHCVALLFSHLEEQERRERTLSRQKAQAELKKYKGITVTTTPSIREILQKRAMRQALPIVQRKTYGKVRLEATLSPKYNGFQVEFRIGIDRMYVMKNVFDFADSMRDHAGFAYGKGLAFDHVPEAFEEKSRPMAEFIMRWVEDYREKHTREYVGGAYYRGESVLRRPVLDIFSLEKFLLALGDNSFTYDNLERKKEVWKVKKGPVFRHMTLVGDEKGIQVSISHLSGYIGKRYYIYFIDGTVHMDPIERLKPIEDFLSCMAGIPRRQIYIGAEDAPAFCRELLPALEQVYECDKSHFDRSLYGVMTPVFEIYLDAPNRDMILCRTEAVYGDHRFRLFDDTPSNIRDLLKENQVRELISNYTNAFDPENQNMAASGSEEVMYRLLTEGIVEFQKIGKVFVSDSVKKIRVRESPHVTLGVSLGGDTLQLSLNTPDLSRHELVEILSRYERKKKYYRLKNGDFIRMDESGVAALQEITEDMGIVPAQLKKEKIQIPGYRALYLEAKSEDSREHGVTIEKNKDFRALIRRMRAVDEGEFRVPDSLKGVLRSYQCEGYFWLKMLNANGFGGILADDMGLGKTLQVICFLLSEWEENEEKNLRTLIVAPASLVYNWKNEIEKFAPGLPVKMIVGKAEERAARIKESGSREVLLTSYDLIRRDRELYEQVPFFCEVIDEAQYIKNHNTKAAQAVKSVSASFRIALTGTPVENRLSELWSIFDYLMPGFLYSYKRFRERIELPAVQDQDEKVFAGLQKMIRPFVLRRLKKQVLRDLPEKLEEEVYAPLAGEQKKLYLAHVQRIRMMLEQKTEEEFRTGKIEILSELTRLRQICCDPALVYENYKGNAEKTELCLDLIENAAAGGHKILLFSQFTSMLQTLQEKLDKRGISFYTLTGNTGKEKRVQLVERFNNDDTSVFCISLKAGGTGLNLTSADVVIHYDPWWNIAVQDQATDRAHRIGQKNVVSVYKLVVKDTIEQNILHLQERKKELAERVLGGESLGRTDFTREELLEILSTGFSG